MTDTLYEQLADALDRLPNGFPRTASGVEIPMLKKVFSMEDATLAVLLGRDFLSLDRIAEKAGFSVRDARACLMDMVKRGLIWFQKDQGVVSFRLTPFIVGIFEFHLDRMDHEFSHLFEEYMAEGGAAGIMKPYPAVHRVIPVRGATKTEWILPYDDVRSVLLAAKSFRLRDCICRVQQDHLGHTCSYPLRMCLSFSNAERTPSPHDISQEEALAVLDRAEEVGLVHTVSNVMEGLWYVCNCCGCCCGILRGITQWGIAESVAYANYWADIDPEICSRCGTCVDRCQVSAIVEEDGNYRVEQSACIGCGLCVTRCPSEAATLQRKPDSEIVHPPVDFSTWENERLIHRVMISPETETAS